MFDKINIIEVITDHWKTLRDYGTKSSSGGDVIIFIFLPVLAAFLLVYFNGKLSKDLVNTLVTAMSVFAALLFNLLMLIYDIIKKADALERVINF